MNVGDNKIDHSIIGIIKKFWQIQKYSYIVNGICYTIDMYGTMGRNVKMGNKY